MKKLTIINSDNIPEIRAAFNEAIQKVCREYGINTSGLGNISYTATSFSTRLEVCLDSAIPSEEQDLNNYKGRRFKFGQRVFTIMEVLPGNRFTGRTQKGKSYNIRLDQLLEMMEVK